MHELAGWFVVAASWACGVFLAAVLVAGWAERLRKALALWRDPVIGGDWRRAWQKAGRS